MTIFSLTLLTQLYAAEKLPCKIEAHVAAYNEYKAHYSDAMITTKSKFQPIVEKNTVIHMIQILDTDRGANDLITVTLDKKTCNVLSID